MWCDHTRIQYQRARRAARCIDCDARLELWWLVERMMEDNETRAAEVCRGQELDCECAAIMQMMEQWMTTQRRVTMA